MTKEKTDQNSACLNTLDTVRKNDPVLARQQTMKPVHTQRLLKSLPWAGHFGSQSTRS
jgi:hypothetical protein